ncbi:MAG: hypothetical protein ACK559_16525, partial [bacterium]
GEGPLLEPPLLVHADVHRPGGREPRRVPLAVDRDEAARTHVVHAVDDGGVRIAGADAAPHADPPALRQLLAGERVDHEGLVVREQLLLAVAPGADGVGKGGRQQPDGGRGVELEQQLGAAHAAGAGVCVALRVEGADGRRAGEEAKAVLPADDEVVQP